MSAISFTDHFHDSSDLVSVTSTQVLSDNLTTERHTTFWVRDTSEPRLLHVSVDTALLLEDAVHSYRSTRYILAYGVVSSARLTPQEGSNFSRLAVSASALTHKLYLVKIN